MLLLSPNLFKLFPLPKVTFLEGHVLDSFSLFQCFQWYDLEDKKSELTEQGVRDRGEGGRNIQAKGTTYTMSRDKSAHRAPEELRWDWDCT